MTVLDRLHRLNDRLTEFGWIARNPGALDATKKLLRGLKERDVSVVRGKAGDPHQYFRPRPPGWKYDPTSLVDFPDKGRIEIGRAQRWSDRSRATTKPVGALWHEAGHHLGRTSIPVSRSVLGSVDPSQDSLLRSERVANRAAIMAATKLGAPPAAVEKYKKSAARWYKTYDPSGTKEAWRLQAIHDRLTEFGRLTPAARA